MKYIVTYELFTNGVSDGFRVKERTTEQLTSMLELVESVPEAIQIVSIVPAK